MKKNWIIVLIVAFLSMMILSVGCKKNNNETESPPKLILKLTDAPFPLDYFETVEVTISRIEMHKSSDNDTNFEIMLNEAKTFNLLDLRGGVTQNLVNKEIPKGTYTKIRMIVDGGRVVLKDGREFNLKVPSGAQTGIKIQLDPALEVSTKLSYELILDFDISKSFKVQGGQNKISDINGFIFSPVIKVANESVSGRISGNILSDSCTAIDNLDNQPLNNAFVSAINADGLVIATNATNESGSFALIGLKPGTYNVLVEKDDFENQYIENVQVVVANDNNLSEIIMQKNCTKTPSEIPSETPGGNSSNEASNEISVE
ncbi:MAG: DUF4382 domain-containing protein [Oligoflexia bacterium]|nr:DUF4382 domain-containing protein [Oligoflexia bacterium]